MKPLQSAMRKTGALLRRIAQAAAGAGMAAALLACGGSGPLAPEASGPLPEPDVSAVAQADPGSPLDASWKNGAFIEVFVRAWKDSDGDGIGDLRGLIQTLDYLQDLGITGIWLMPVMPSQDKDHGYAVTDYRNIEPAYGRLADFDELLRQAHARGIGVIIDYVINHSAALNPLFLQSSSGPGNAWRDWYIWQASVPSGWRIYNQNPWYSTANGAYFAGFWSQMPDFNLRHPQVLAYHQDSLRFWLNRGVDGFRFDAVGNLIENSAAAWENQPENHALMNGVRQLVMGYAGRYMVCESPGAPQAYGLDDSCGGSFAFAHQAKMLGAAAGDAASVAEVVQYYVDAPPGMASFLSNHDAFAGQRIWNQVDGQLASYRLAAATNLLQANTPFIYYGEEIGMAGAASLSGDPKLRTPMSWSADARNAGFSSGTPFRALSANVATNNVATQQADPASLLNFYKQVITLRKSRPSLMLGRYAAASASGRVMSFQRVLGSELTLVAFNYGRTAASAALAGLPADARLRRLWPAGAEAATADAGGRASLSLPPQGFAVFAVEAP